MKRTFACLLLLSLLLCALPALGEAMEFPARVCEDAPLLSIAIVDTGEVEPATEDKILRADITAEDGSLSQSLTYHAIEAPSSDDPFIAAWLEDLNFDGYADLCLRTVMGARNDRMAFALWNPETGRFDEVYTEPLYLPEDQDDAGEAEYSWLSNYGLHPESGMVDCYMADGAANYDWTVYRWEGRRLRLIGVATLRTLSDGDFLRERVWRLDGSCRWEQTCPLAWYYAEAAIFDERQEAIQAALMGQDFSTANTRDRAALYSLDSEDSAALTTLPQGAALQVLKADCGRDGTWARVLYAPADAPAQLTGYVRMAQVQLQEAQ